MFIFPKVVTIHYFGGGGGGGEGVGGWEGVKSFLKNKCSQNISKLVWVSKY